MKNKAYIQDKMLELLHSDDKKDIIYQHEKFAIFLTYKLRLYFGGNFELLNHFNGEWILYHQGNRIFAFCNCPHFWIDAEYTLYCNVINNGIFKVGDHKFINVFNKLLRIYKRRIKNEKNEM